MNKDFRLVGAGIFLLVVSGLIGYLLLHEPKPSPKKPAPVVPSSTQKTEDTVPEPVLGEIAGHVVDSEGKPVSGARVQAGNGETPAAETTTQNGSFVLQVADGTYDIMASMPALGTAHKTRVATGTRDLTLKLVKESSVTGQVVADATGAPVASFEVAVLPAPVEGMENERLSKGVEWTSVDEPDGRFTLGTVVGGVPLLVVARAEGYSPSFVRTDPVASGTTGEPVVVRLSAGKTLKGVVKDNEGNPVDKASVFVGKAGRFTSQQDAATDAQGTFTISTLTADNTEVMVTHPAYAPTIAEIPPDEGAVSITVVLDQGGTVEGLVRRGQTVLGNWRVKVTPEPAGRFKSLSAMTDNDGRYVIERVPAGEVSVTCALDSANTSTQTASVESGSTTTVDFEFSGDYGAVEGNITVGEEPASSGTASLRPAGVSNEEVFSAAIEGGAFYIGNVPPGKVTLDISVTSSTGVTQKTSVQFEVGDGETVRRDFSFDVASAIAGVVDGVREGEHGVVLALEGDSIPVRLPLSVEDFLQLQTVVVAKASVEADSTYRLDGLHPGTYTLVVAVIPRGTTLTPEAFPSARGTSRVVELPLGKEIKADFTVK